MRRAINVRVSSVEFKLGVLAFAGALAWALSAAHVNFVDITDRTGLDFRLEHSPTPEKFLPETMGGGVAVVDYDNDGRLDVFFLNGARLSPSMTAKDSPDKSDPKYWNRLFHQNKDGTFTESAERAGLTGRAQNRYGMGVATGDYDNDGFEDIFVTGVGGNTLYHNNENGTFTDVTEHSGVGGSGWSTSAGFFDYDNDGKVDLFICRYVEWSFGERRYCGDRSPGGRAYCHPDNFRGIANLLFHNNGDGTFTDVSGKSGIANPGGKSLGVTFADFDGDGWTDIYVANDSVPCFLYRNNRNGTFTDVAPEAGVGFNEDGQTFAGMGTDFADYDNDGKPDLVVTDLSNQRYVIFHNNGQGVFTDLTTQSGVGGATAAYSGWSTRFLDFDNDGWKDLFFAQGHVMDNIEMTTPNIRYLQPPLLLRNTGGRFALVDGGPGLKKSLAGRGAAFGDLDNDGRLDIVSTNLGEKAYILHNETESTNGWIKLEFTGKKSNRDGIGCLVKVTNESNLSQFYTVNTAVGYLSASDKRLTVGLGTGHLAQSIELVWPSGIRQRFENIRTGTTVRAVEPI